ncbi:ATP-binding protein [Aquabacterium humicola]|uniref:ATP-binding protein n=1 Tax=Aquabacterium humicola TaxID=3237377 RepID=UPI0025438E89|nr:ATP-binding protein [Rubrivivax pictus]
MLGRWLPLQQGLLHGNGLARRVLVYVVLFSSAITALITAAELYAGYRRDLRAIDSAFEFVGANYLPSLTNSVWNVDDIQVQSQLDALASLPDVEYIAILEDGQTRWFAGRAVSLRTREMMVPLVRGSGPGGQTIGQLRIVASVDRVLGRVWARLAEVLLANAVKTMLVAGFLLVCFQVLITQHLAKVARFVRGIDLQDPAALLRRLELDRRERGRWRPDILDTVVEATNGLLRSLHEARQRLVLSQAELAESEARLRLGLEAAGAGLWDWDIVHARLYLGPDCLRILGRETSAEAAGPRQHDYAYWEAQIHPDDLAQARSAIRRHFEDSRPEARFTVEMRMRNDLGDWRWMSWRGRLVERDARGAPRRAVGTMADIHQRKQAESAVLEVNRQLEARVRERTQALEQARDEAERASQAKSEFLSRMSHELRTPMNAILGFAQLMNLSNADPTLQRWSAEIEHAGEHLLKLIDELLDLSRIEVGKLQVHLDPVLLAPLLHDAVGIVQAALPRQKVQFDVRPEASLPAVSADPLRLKQILVNLLSNAVKYTPGGGRIVIGAQPLADGRVRVSVTDQGLGIPKDRLDRLFQPFERLGREDTAIEGTGVGLSLSKRLAELMGCEMGVDSVEGRGSTFWIDLLPAAPPVAAPAAVSSDAAPLEPQRGLRVLYVEDNPTNRTLMEAFFQTQPAWRLLLAEDGERGLAAARAESPDAILLDLHLPGIDGYEVLRALRESPQTVDIPVIALTADAKADERERGLLAGFAQYITKPVKFGELAAALDRLAAEMAR